MDINQDSYLSNIFEPELFTQNRSVDLTYSAIYKYDSLISLIVDKYPNDAYNLGYEIESDSKELYEDYLNGIRVYETFRKASKYARLYGLCCAFIMFGDNEQLNLPVRPNAQPVGLKLYRLNLYQDIEQEVIQIGTTLVHRSRLLFFTGKEVFVEFGDEIKTGYTSILDGFLDEYQKYKPMAKIFNKLVNTSNQVILGTKGLSARLRADILNGTDLARRELLERAKAVNTGRSVQDIIVHDLENEEIKNISLSVAGVTEVFEKLEHLLAIRIDYPYHVIFGENVSSTLGSGSNAQLIYRMMYADKLTQWIDNNWTENIEKLCEFFRFSSNLSDYEVNIPLAYVLSDDEKAEIGKKMSETLEKILTYYPMDYEQIRDFINNNFPFDVDELQFNPAFDIPVSVPNVPSTDVNTDSGLPTVLENAATITREDVDEIMEDIGKQSK